jgi:hypothetical protein
MQHVCCVHLCVCNRGEVALRGASDDYCTGYANTKECCAKRCSKPECFDKCKVNIFSALNLLLQCVELYILYCSILLEVRSARCYAFHDSDTIIMHAHTVL